MKYSNLLFILGLFGVAGPHYAHATTITFDELTEPPQGTQLVNYAGFLWSAWFAEKDAAHGGGLPNLHSFSPPNVAVDRSDVGSPSFQNGPPIMAIFTSSSPFTFNSAELRQYIPDGGVLSEAVTVLGYALGSSTPTHTSVIDITTANFSLETFDWTGLGKVAMYPNVYTATAQIIMDNIEVNDPIPPPPTVPEPNGAETLVIGLLGLGAIRMSCRRGSGGWSPRVV